MNRERTSRREISNIKMSRTFQAITTCRKRGNEENTKQNEDKMKKKRSQRLQ